MSISDERTKRRIAIILFIIGGSALAAALIFFNVMKNDASAYRKMIMKATDKTPAQLDPEPAPSAGPAAAESDNGEFAAWTKEAETALSQNIENIFTGPAFEDVMYTDGVMSVTKDWKKDLEGFSYEDLSSDQQITYDLFSHFVNSPVTKNDTSKENYEAVIERRIGAGKTIQDYSDMLDSYIEQVFSESDAIISQNKAAKNALKKFTYPEGTYEELAGYIYERAGEETGEFDISDTAYEEIKEFSPNDERYSYVKITPGEDDKYTFVLDKTTADEKKNLYTAVARDIIPGTISLQQNTGSPADVYLIPYGVRDGVSSYAEFMAYDYIDGDDKSVIDLKRNNSRSILLLSGKADMMVNYYGSPDDEVKNYLTGYGVSDEDARNRILDHVRSVPGDYASRALGYAEVMEMQRKAKDLKKENYSDKAFYEFLKKYGGLPFSCMEKRLYMM